MQRRRRHKPPRARPCARSARSRSARSRRRRRARASSRAARATRRRAIGFTSGTGWETRAKAWTNSRWRSRDAPSACARSVRIDGGGGDRYSSYVGDVAAQVSAVCEAVVGETRRASGTTRTHALGFSQGGQFARALVETCDGVKFTTLVTFGAQHLGVDALPGCGGDWATISRACRAMNAMASALSASDFARRRIVQAQYFRDTSTNAKYQRYLETNAFLPWVNNEGTANERDGASRREALTSLERFVMFMFEFDDMVFPKESSWFGSRVVGGSNRSEIIPYDRNDVVYESLGLAALDADGRLEARLVPAARHMQLSLDWFVREVVEKYYSDSGSDAL